MEAIENENITSIVQFKAQLLQLRDTFNGIPTEDRTAAALAVRSLLDELIHICSRPHSIDQHPDLMEETFEDSVNQISSISVSLCSSDTFENIQLPNIFERACNFTDQELSFPESNVNSLSKNCLNQLDCELSSLVLATKFNQIAQCRSSAPNAIHELVTNGTAQGVSTRCEKGSTPIHKNESFALLCNANSKSVDVTVGWQVLPEGLEANNTVEDLNECAEEVNGGDKAIVILDSIRDPCPPLCMTQKSKLGLCKGMNIDKSKPQDDEIVPRIGPSLNGRITRSMARINHRKQRQKGQPNNCNGRQKRKMSAVPTSGDHEVVSDAILDSISGSKLKDISSMSESDKINNMEPSEKRQKMSEDQKNATTEKEDSAMDATSACLLIRAGGMVSCRQCRLEFKSFGAFNKHTCKSGNQVFTCKHCDLYFNRPQKFQNHLNNHARNNCKICGAQFSKREALIRHNKSEHRGLVEPAKYYHCPLCEEKFVKRPSLYVHLKEHADLKIVCMKCGTMCDGEEQYSQHMAKHAEEANFHCDKCNENFVWRQKYEQHIAGHDKYQCALCDSKFCTKKQMVKHRRIVHGIKVREQKKHECTICQKRFQRQSTLKMHIAMHNGETPLQCSICSKNYRTLKSLAKHMKTAAHLKASQQSNEKPSSLEKSFLCAECGAKFYRKQGLARHMQQLHSEDRPFECSFCDYTCKCKTNLKRHVELHKNERRFVCELCGSSFHAHGTLKEHHAYVHSEDRQFVCQKCGKGFKGRSGLRRHIRSHSDNRPFVCYCGQSYKRMSHLKRHMMSIHSIAFKSKRVQRIGSDDQGSSTYDDSNPATHFQYGEPGTDLVSVDAASQPQTIMLPVSATDRLLIIDKSLHQEMAQSMTLEVADVVTHMDIPKSEPQLMTHAMTGVDQLSLGNSTQIPLMSSVNEQIPNACILPSIMDAAELNQTFDLGNVTIPISNCGISMAPPLPSLNPQTFYHTVENMDSSLAFSLQSGIPELTNSVVQTLPTEFYTQSLAQYMSSGQPELI